MVSGQSSGLLSTSLKGVPGLGLAKVALRWPDILENSSSRFFTQNSGSASSPSACKVSLRILESSDLASGLLGNTAAFPEIRNWTPVFSIQKASSTLGFWESSSYFFIRWSVEVRRRLDFEVSERCTT